MRITSIHIQNFRSLRDVRLDQIGNMTVLIGRNGAGKSNIFEALNVLVSGLDAEIERELGSLDAGLWFAKNDDAPIRITAELVFDDGGFSKIYPDGGEGSKAHMVRIAREIIGPASKARIRTADLEIDGVPLIRDGTVTEGSQASDTRKGGGEKETSDANTEDRVKTFLKNLTEEVKRRFLIIQAARNGVPVGASSLRRTPIMPSETVKELMTLSQTIEPREYEKTWVRIQETFKDMCPYVEELKTVQGSLVMRERGSDVHIPVGCWGGGQQEVLALVDWLSKEDTTFVLLEEPEMHLHPGMIRKLFSFLRRLSSQKQVIISTHSPILVDRRDIETTWIVQLRGGETKVSVLKDAEEFSTILQEIGARPSDVFFAEGVVFVEGLSDAIFLSKMAEKMGIDVEQSLRFVQTGGKGSGKYHLQVWSDAAKNVKIPFFAIYDSDAEEEAGKVKSLEKDVNLLILEKGTIEEYYDGEKLIAALERETGDKIPPEWKGKILSTPRVDRIKEWLKENRKQSLKWKVPVAEAVAEQMSIEELDEEIRSILERIRTSLSTEQEA